MMWQDIRFALRMLRKSPGFTAIALVTLAIGIGANTVMFGISDLLLALQPRKVKNPEQLLYCGLRGALFDLFSYSGYLTVRGSGLAFGEIMAQTSGAGESATLTRGDSVWEAQAGCVSSNYFSFLGVAPLLGRGFLPEEERQGSAPVAVLSHRLWQRLGGNPKSIGEFISLNGAACQIVGVAPEGFTGAALEGPDLWLSLGSYRAVSTRYRKSARPANASADWDYPWVNLVGRLQPGLDLPVAQAQLQSLVPRFQAEYPRQWKDGASFSLRPTGRFDIEIAPEQGRLRVAVFSLVLMTASALVLVIACLNLANMLLVQGVARQREIAVRLALGAGRGRIVRQLLLESGLLALPAGALGVLLAFWGTRILNLYLAAIPDSHNPIRSLQIGLNVRVLAATLGLCLLAALLAGLRPALRLSRRDIAGEMKATAGRVSQALGKKRGGLSVAGQTALAVALVLSAALLTHSALQLARPDPRFSLDDKLLVQIDPLSVSYDRAQNLQACEALADHLASLPQVQALGATPGLFYGGGASVMIGEYLPGAEKSESRKHLVREAAFVTVGRDYFKAMDIPLLQGRSFDRLDRAPKAEKVAIIDESLARKLRPDGNALGCFIQWGVPELGEMIPDIFRVVGIVPNLPGVGDREVRAQMYMPTQADALSPYFYLRMADGRSADALRGAIAQEIRRFDPRIPILSVATVAQRRDEDSSIWLARLGARLALAAGTAALFLAALGIYGVKGYMVASRTAEIGIRKTLGATHGNIIGMVLREGLVLTIVGLLIGLLLGLGVAKVAASMLYGISPADPASIVATVVLLGAASLLASYLPARRAAKVDPMVALRSE
jgi:putative ABC transport system permease protein